MAHVPKSAPTQARSGPTRTERRGRRYASPQQAAEYLDVSTRTIRQMIADGRLTGYRASVRLVRVDLDEVDAAMQPYGGGAI